MHPRTSQPSPKGKQEVELKQEPRVKEDLTEEDILAPPVSDDSSDEEDVRSGDIKKTVFRKGSEEPVQATGNGRVGGKTKIATVNSNKSTGKRGTRGSKKTDSPPSSIVSSASSSSVKRKSTESLSKLGAGLQTDAFGVLIPAKKVKTSKKVGYGKQARESRSNQPKMSQGMLANASVGTRELILMIENSPVKKFKAISDIESSPEPELDLPLRAPLKPINPNEFDSPIKSDSAPKKLTIHALSPGSSPASTPEPVAKFFNPGQLSPEEGDREPPVILKRPEIPDTSFEDSELETHTTTVPVRRGRGRPKKTPLEEPATQHVVFKNFLGEGDGDLINKALEITGQEKELQQPFATQFEDYEFASTQLTRCPMCNQPVDQEDLRKLGDMNTRQQEKFCRSHQIRDAQDDWELKGYPLIDWSKLNSRISKHHSFIKEVINGANSHYREVLNEIVRAGKDRNLLKSTSNLTPGYYGSRGLQVISENIMQKFTPLLKKRVVKDRLMAARGVTGFVQSVLVPEVTVLLIIEDMGIDIEEAREVLKDSVGVGELIHEEVRDVIMRRVEDSEEEDEGEF
jgi:hypothetical protein